MRKILHLLLIAGQTNAMSFYMGSRIGIDMSTLSLKGKISSSIKKIEKKISSEKNSGKFASRTTLGASLESFFSVSMFSLGFCIDAGKSFRSKNSLEANTNKEKEKYTIKANTWTLGTTGVLGVNFALMRFLLFAGPHGQYMEYKNETTNDKHKEWQWTPMVGAGAQIRLGITVLELRYLHPAQINLFKQGSDANERRITFNKKGPGVLSVAALMRI
ncbi:outer membrane beta-barrel protein [Candidatus Cytomitobacter indipagum]|uniref:Outer membrane beta-barrel protein n=1 Tax=Candidatus Cytomitobacter indipagum TaxID=2601575 RepID=A0A5C0UCU5_9PROT|nr:outer membrane beta-barrel protein [Candidatus Cytomitobacter indipagum]QEK37835.1 outer membrane beta-barrel protein [Candidatus Cytomitobacter indipagum]